MRIAIVDDEQLIVDGLKKIISRRYPDADLSGFTDPAEALLTLSRKLPDLLISDIRMPEMDGFTLIAAMRERGLIHYAILTGLNDVPLLQESIRLRVADYLIKPVNKDELFALIDRVQEALNSAPEHVTAALAEHFRTADMPDADIMEQLTDQMRRSDCPPDFLDRFLSKANRDLTFWETCRLAARILTDNTDSVLTMEKLRSLPHAIRIASAEVERIRTDMQARFREDLSVSGMAAQVHLQPNYLTTLFRKETGKGFIQYLNQLRIEHACRLLLERTAPTMSRIAQDCGFATDRYFFAAFKKCTGVTPGEFRDEMVKTGVISS